MRQRFARTITEYFKEYAEPDQRAEPPEHGHPARSAWSSRSSPGSRFRWTRSSPWRRNRDPPVQERVRCPTGQSASRGTPNPGHCHESYRAARATAAKGGEDPKRGSSPRPTTAIHGAAPSSRSRRAGSASPSITSTHAKEIQIKMAQGAKPGEGGELPGTARSTPAIAKTRHSTSVGRPDLSASAPRYLFDRGHGATDPRPEEREPRSAHQCEAGLRGGRRHDRRRGRKGPRRRRPDQRPRRRHRGLAADEHQARRAPVGARPRRHAPDPRAQRPAQPHRRRDRRPAQDRARRGGRRPARGRGVRFRDHRPGRHGLHHDAGLPPRHLSRGGGDPEPGAAREVLGHARSRGQLPALRRPGAARDHGGPGVPHRRRDGGAHRQADPGAQRSLEGQGRRPVEDPPHAGGARQRRPLLPDRPGPRARALPRRGDPPAAVRAGDRPRRKGPGRAAGPEHQPGGRQHHRQRAQQALRPRRTSR